MKQYLLSYGIERLEQTGKTHIVNGTPIRARKRTNNKWFETQDSISYWDDFFRPKIVYQELSQGCSFAIDNKGDFFISNTGYLITGKHLDYLLQMLNSPVIEYVYRRFYGTTLGSTGLRWLAQHINNLPIPLYREAKEFQQVIEATPRNLLYAVGQLYGLSLDELSMIENQ